MEKKNKEKERNVYKITTYVLLGIILLIFISFLFMYYSNLKFNQGFYAGRNNAVGEVIQNVIDKGSVKIYSEDLNLTLVPQEYITLGQENLVKSIYENVKNNGYVTLNLYNETLTLVPYYPPQKEQINNSN